MPQPIPKFCPIHLKIHVCEEQTITNRLNKIENDLGAKVRRLHGIQTEEDIAGNEKKYKNPPGSLGAILEQAKANIAKQKSLIKTNNNDLNEGKEVSEQEVSSRIEALKLKINGKSPVNNSTPPIAPLSPPPKDIQENNEPTLSPLDIAVAKLDDEEEFERDYFTKEETEELIKVVVSDILSKQKKTPATTKKTVAKPKQSSKITAKPTANKPKPSSKITAKPTATKPKPPNKKNTSS